MSRLSCWPFISSEGVLSYLLKGRVEVTSEKIVVILALHFILFFIVGTSGFCHLSLWRNVVKGCYSFSFRTIIYRLLGVPSCFNIQPRMWKYKAKPKRDGHNNKTKKNVRNKQTIIYKKDINEKKVIKRTRKQKKFKT